MAIVRCSTALRQSGWDVRVGDILDSAHYLVATYPSFFTWNTTNTATIAVTVPAITDPDIASVDVDISADSAAAAPVGTVVRAIPMEALEATCRVLNAYVIATDSIRVVFGSEGGSVTGGAKNFKFNITY